MQQKDFKDLTMEERVEALKIITEIQGKIISELHTKLLILEQQFEEKHREKDYVDVILEQRKEEKFLGDIAKDYGLTWDELVDILDDKNLVKKIGDSFEVNSEIIRKKFFNKPTGKWTQKGRLEIHRILTDLGIKANMDKG